MIKKAPAPKKSAQKTPPKKPENASRAPAKSPPKAPQQPEWLQDVSLEAPVPASFSFNPGERQLEFSVGMRQLDENTHVRSELRARALIHAGNVVLALVEASYVNLAPKNEIRENLPAYLYTQLKPQLEKLLALTGHTPPLPASLEKVA